MEKIRIDQANDALIVVDVQNDFCPGGALAVPRGDQVVEPINHLLHLPWLTVATRDWHPGDHCSFKEQGGIWPVHCVAHTWGAELHPDLDRSRIQLVVSKATSREHDAYSGFEGTDLASTLQKRQIRRCFICGLATDYCVKATALDALKAGLAVWVVEEAIRGVEVKPGDVERALSEMRAAGVRLVSVNQIEGEQPLPGFKQAYPEK